MLKDLMNWFVKTQQLGVMLPNPSDSHKMLRESEQAIGERGIIKADSVSSATESKSKY